MKRKRGFSVQLIVGILLILLAVASAVFLDGYLGSSSSALQRLIWVLSVLGLGSSGLAGIFFGLSGFLGGFGFILIICLPQVLPDPWNRYFSFLYLGCLFLIPWALSVQKKKKSRKPTSKHGTKDAALSKHQEDISLEEDSFDEDHTLLAAPDGTPLILVQQTTNGRFYQLIRGSGKILAYRVGGELRGLDVDLVIPNNSPTRELGKHDFSIDLDAVSSVRFKELANSNPGYDFVAIVKTAKRSYRFAPTDFTTNEDFEEFWRKHLSRSIPQKNAAHQTAPTGTPDKKRLEVLKKVRIAYCFYIGLTSLPWLFLNVPYVLFSVLNLLSLPIGLGLYFAFPKELTMDEKEKKTKGKHLKKLSIVEPVLLSCCAMPLRSFMDFNILTWGQLLLISIILTVIIVVLCLVLSKEWKTTKSTILAFVMVAVFYSFGAVIQVNCTFDPYPPESAMGTVTDMYISTSSKAPDSYMLTVAMPDGTELDLETSPEYYESFQIGDTAEIYTYPGLLGIDYAYVG